MLARKMILNAIDYLQERISGQTLTNYIKAGVCVGAAGTDTGIQSQGVQAEYFPVTAVETAVARNIIGSLNRKLTMEDIAFARYVSVKVLTGEITPFIENSEWDEMVNGFFGDKVEFQRSDQCYEYSSIYFSSRKIRKIIDYKGLVAEWIYKFLFYSTVDIDYGYIESLIDHGTEFKRITVPENLLVVIRSDEVIMGVHNIGKSSLISDFGFSNLEVCNPPDNVGMQIDYYPSVRRFIVSDQNGQREVYLREI